MVGQKKLVFALAGNPNCGKTTLFNSLTGSTAYVGNWPGVTVEKRSGTYTSKKKGLSADIVDLPGIYSLSPYTPEEVISRNFILDEHPDCIINVIDSTNLERNLYLTTQIMEMDVPVILALNMTDALKDQGQSIDAAGLSKALGVPVVAISALRERNLDDLMEEAVKAAGHAREGKMLWDAKEEQSAIEQARAIYEKEKIANPLFHCLKALEGDEVEEKKNGNAFALVKGLGVDTEAFEAASADYRYRYITADLAIYRKGVAKEQSQKMSRSDKIDRVLTNRWAALPILAVVLFLIFHFTFSADLFFLHAAGVNLGEGYEGLTWWTYDGEAFKPFAGLFYDDAGIVSIGEFFHRLAGDNETGILGVIVQGFGTLLKIWNAPEWVHEFFVDGLFNGVASVLGFVPQIALLFFFFSILEDSGYMARIAFVLDRIFRRFGVSGRAVLPMIMGLGCGVPAMINTRTLNTDKERVKTIRVIPYFTCGAKAEILTVVSAAFATAFGFDAGLFVFLMYLIGIVLAFLMVVAMNNTTQREHVPPFVMELPAYHMPQPKSVSLHVWDKAKHFIQKAFTIILVSTVVVWFLQSFTPDWTFIPTADSLTVADSILGHIGMILQPLATPLGWGYQIRSTYNVDTGALIGTGGANNLGWTYSVATIQGVVAKEAVTSTMTQLSSVVPAAAFSGGQTDMSVLMAATGISAGGVVSFTIYNLLTVPCFASVATAKGELGRGKAYWGTLAFWLIPSYIIASCFYLMIDYHWTIAIIVPVAILAFLGTFFYNRYKNDKELKAQQASEAK